MLIDLGQIEWALAEIGVGPIEKDSNSICRFIWIVSQTAALAKNVGPVGSPFFSKQNTSW